MPRYRDLQPDLVCCKMTLEHVPHTAAFVNNIRRTLGAHSHGVVVFMIPEVTRILELRAF